MPDPRFREIVKLFQKLPGVGPRQAARFVLALLEKPEAELKALGQAIGNLKKEITFCQQCHNLTNGHDLCVVCRDPKRDQSKIMVVEKVTDLEAIERTGLYKGSYHVLGGAINPLDKVLPEKLNIEGLKKRLTDPAQKIELIIATNLNTSGETTALYLTSLFEKTGHISLTRLARGLASGSHLEYADESTLKHALEYRK